MAKGFISIKFSEQSLAKLRANLMLIDIKTKQGAKKALKTTATNIMAQSQSEVPRETETLLSTAYIEQPKVSGDIVSLNLGYASSDKDKRNPLTGKMASEYALVVHETPPSEAKHPYGKWKYLADPTTYHKNELFSEFNMEVRNVVA